ncbi:MAG TPA: SDR family NAD(P)-dependent oxidoreductase [Actinomycetes bacterium]|nr:SDR family NAD(P)-dependent oxidoreductase [Actinomycetes bacterium]
MRILVTGGTGYVGSHTVAALCRAGHDVRLLARDKAAVPAALDPLGVTVSDVVFGDVTDPTSVASAVDSCDAVVHAASIYSLSPRDWARIRHTNVRGTEVVLAAAVAAGADPIVHVSSTSAIMPAQPGGLINADNPPTVGAPGAYIASKAGSEAVARRYQDAGAPVVTTYPGGVFGPHDPHLGEGTHRLSVELRGLMPVMPNGGTHYCDVRDVAALHARVLEPGLEPRRYVVPGHYRSGADEIRTLARLTGRRLPCVAVPAGPLMASLAPLDAVLRFTRRQYPGTREGAWFLSRSAHADSSAADALGIVARPYDESIADTVRWLLASGHISARQAGRLDGRPVG